MNPPLDQCTRRQLLGTLIAGASSLCAESVQHAAEPAGQRRDSTAADARIRGPFPILSTPFTEAGEVDFEVLTRQARFVDWGGCPGMIWPQSGDSVDLLTTDEKLRGMDVLAEASRGLRAVLCLGVQGKDTEEMLIFARHVERLAPAAIISRPPDSGQTEDDLRRYWRALAAVAQRPVILQTTGGVAYEGPVPSVPLLIELAQEFPHFGYIKEEAAPVIARTRELLAARPPIRRVFSARGGHGCQEHLGKIAHGIARSGSQRRRQQRSYGIRVSPSERLTQKQLGILLDNPSIRPHHGLAEKFGMRQRGAHYGCD